MAKWQGVGLVNRRSWVQSPSVPLIRSCQFLKPHVGFVTSSSSSVEKVFLDEKSTFPIDQQGMVAKWQGVGLVNRRSWVQTPSVPLFSS